MSEITTKNRILDTAEKLFAAHGFAATSLRAIIKEAGVNTASVHYHFGSKEGLIEAVLQRRAAPVNSERLERLEALEADYPTGALPLEEVLETFLAPAILTHFKPSKRGRVLPQLVGRAIAEPDEKLRAIIRDIFADVFRRYTVAFMRALPDLTPDEVIWRMHFMIGAMVFTVAMPRVQQERPGMPKADPEQMLQRLIDFFAAGMRSPMGETTQRDG
jgi:AcrR family transcriptional regulator